MPACRTCKMVFHVIAVPRGPRGLHLGGPSQDTVGLSRLSPKAREYGMTEYCMTLVDAEDGIGAKLL